MKKVLTCSLLLTLTFSLCFIGTTEALFHSHATEAHPNATLISFTNDGTEAIATDVSYELGDTNNDNRCNTLDLLAVKKCISGVSNSSTYFENRADINCNGQISSTDLAVLKRIISGSADIDELCVYAEGSSVSWNSTKKAASITSKSSDFSVTIDFSDRGWDFTTGNHPYAVVDYGGNIDSLSVTPVFDSQDYGSKNNTANESSQCIYQLKGRKSAPLTGLVLTLHSNSSNNTVTVPEIYLCDSLESAEWIYNNRILPPSNPTPKNLKVDYTETIAIRLTNMTNDDKQNVNGGMYHDFVNTKWPSVAVDENDKLYVVSSGIRMAHIDPFGVTVMATSEDGGKTFSKPRNIYNTVMDDRDAGIEYLGNGKFVVTTFTNSAENYLPGGADYDSLRPYDQGGNAPSWAAEWNSSYRPVGGIIGTHLDILENVVENDPSYDTSAASYVVMSSDYGQTWNTTPLTLTGSYTSAMSKMVSDYKMNYPAIKVPVTSPHGPTLLSNGTLLYAGKIMSGVDQARDSMAVYASDDDGATWSYLSEIPTPVGYEYNNFHELSVTETADGALLCTIRTQPCGDVSVTPELTIYTCFSYDKGLTWTTPEPTGINGSPPHVETMANGDIVMTYSYRVDPRAIYATVSRDGGRTWSDRARISREFPTKDDMGYPASVQLSDGTVCTVYYGTKGTEQYSSIFSSSWTYTLN